MSIEVIKEYYDEAKAKLMYELWCKDGKLHRLDGPAFQRWDENGQRAYESWYIEHRFYTKEEFDQYVKGLDSKEDIEMLSDLGQSFD